MPLKITPQHISCLSQHVRLKMKDSCLVKTRSHLCTRAIIWVVTGTKARQIFTTSDTLSLANWCFKKTRSLWALYFLLSTQKSILFCNALIMFHLFWFFRGFFFFFFIKISSENSMKKGKGFTASKFLFLFFLGKSQFEFKNRPEKCLAWDSFNPLIFALE